MKPTRLAKQKPGLEFFETPEFVEGPKMPKKRKYQSRRKADAAYIQISSELAEKTRRNEKERVIEEA